MARINYQLIFIYLLSIFLAYPVVAHILMYEFDYMTDQLARSSNWGFIQVLFSGPGLVVSGLMLCFKFPGKIHKTFGIIFFVAGAFWLFCVIDSLIKEAA